jgi:hypothetical protein
VVWDGEGRARGGVVVGDGEGGEGSGSREAEGGGEGGWGEGRGAVGSGNRGGVGGGEGIGCKGWMGGSWRKRKMERRGCGGHERFCSSARLLHPRSTIQPSHSSARAEAGRG